jgi:hypothetical protein
MPPTIESTTRIPSQKAKLNEAKKVSDLASRNEAQKRKDEKKQQSDLKQDRGSRSRSCISDAANHILVVAQN